VIHPPHHHQNQNYTAADHWIIGRRVGEREFYMLLDQKQYTLAQANNEIDRLCSTFFNNIYM
jgi:hypothetical protein